MTRREQIRRSESYRPPTVQSRDWLREIGLYTVIGWVGALVFQTAYWITAGLNDSFYRPLLLTAAGCAVMIVGSRILFEATRSKRPSV